MAGDVRQERGRGAEALLALAGLTAAAVMVLGIMGAVLGLFLASFGDGGLYLLAAGLAAVGVLGAYLRR